jgi:excisionase family DNA binding protein
MANQPNLTPGATESPLLLKPEAASYLRISVRCLTDQMKKKKIAFHRIGGRAVRFKREDLDHYLETVVRCEAQGVQL